MKILFVHNTMAEYRVPFFLGLNEKLNVEYLFTHMDLNRKVYGNDINEEKIKNLKYMCLTKKNGRKREIKNILTKGNYDKIILPPLDSFIDCYDAWIIKKHARKNNKKLIYFGEKWEAPRDKQPTKKYIKNIIQRIAFKIILRKIDLCIVSGSKSKEYFENAIGVDEKKIEVVIDASGVDEYTNTRNIRKLNNLDNDNKIILYYGRIIERKGLDILIKASNNIIEKDNNVFLLVCGEGDFKTKCEELVNSLNMKNVIFEGYISPKQRFEYFSQCDIFVLPSYFYNGISEAWGLTVNEALQCGKPVIATNAVGAAYDLLNGSNGKMVKENDIEDLRVAIEEFLYTKNGIEISEICKGTYEKSNYDNMINGFKLAITNC